VLTQKSFFNSLLDQFLISGTNFLLSLILARVMMPAEFGLYVFSFTLMVLAVGLLNYTVTNPMNVLGAATKPENKNQYFFNLFVVYLIVGFILGVIFVLIGFGLGFTNHRTTGVIICTVGLILLFYLGHEFFRNALLTSLKVRNALVIDCVAYGLRIVIIGAAIGLDYSFDCQQVLWLYGLTSLLAALLGARLLKFNYRNKLDMIMLKETWDYAKWTLADWIPFILSSQLEIYMVTFILSSAETGVLGACRNLVAPLTVVLMGLMSFALPYNSRLYAEKGEAQMRRSLIIFFGVLIGGVLIYLLIINIFAKQLLYLLFGKFEQYDYVVLIISLGVFINYIFKPAEVYLRIIRKPKYIFLSRFMTAGLITLACYPMIKYMGLAGAAWYHVLAQIVMCLALYGFILYGSINADGIPETIEHK